MSFGFSFANVIDLAADGDSSTLEKFLPIVSGFPRDRIMEGIYAQILFYDLAEDADGLASLIRDLRPLCGEGAHHALPLGMLRLAELRLGILRGDIDASLADALVAAIWPAEDEETWRGECAFVAAVAYRALGRAPRSRELFGRAARLLEAGGATRKAALATQHYRTL